MEMIKKYNSNGVLSWKKDFDPKTDPLFNKTNDIILDYIIKIYIYNPLLVVFVSITTILYFSTCYLFDLDYFSLNFIWIFPILILIVIIITAIIQSLSGFIVVAEYKQIQYEYTEALKISINKYVDELTINKTKNNDILK